jgi:hypothetical protein
LFNSVNSGVKENRNAATENRNAAITAQQSVADSFETKWKYVVEYRNKRDALDESAEDYEKQKAELKKQYVSKTPEGVNSSNIDFVDEYTIKNKLLENAKKFETIDTSSYIQEGIEYDKKQIEETLIAIADKEYKMPDGTLISFIDNGKPINVQLAISRLQNGISMWQADTGDVGESSKMFTLLATYIKADISAGGMGASELMLMVFIIFLAIIQEVGIAYCTPAAIIDRATLKLVSRYCEWENNIEKEDFLIDVYIEYVGDGVFSEATFEEKCQKSGGHFLLTRENVKEKYIPKSKTIVKKETSTKTKKEYSNKVDNLVKEIEELI